MKGWRLISLYYNDREQTVTVHFTHYTGRRTQYGTCEYDLRLMGDIPLETFRRVLRRHLTLTKST